MAKKTYKQLDGLAVRLANRACVDLDALDVPDQIYVIFVANRFDLMRGTLAAGLRFMGNDHLSKLIDRWAEGGDPSKYDLDNPDLLD